MAILHKRKWGTKGIFIDNGSLEINRTQQYFRGVLQNSLGV